MAHIFDLVLCLSQAVDLVSPLVADHHKRTAQIAFGLGKQMNLGKDELRDLVIAAALHDVGGLTSKDRLGTLDFEFQDPYGHSVKGYLLLKSYPPFALPAEIVRCHHVPWQNGQGAAFEGRPVLLSSHLLHLADRVAVLVDPERDVLEEVDGIMETILPQAGERFHPDLVRGLEILSKKEAFWLDIVFQLSLNSLDRSLEWPQIEITGEDFFGLTGLFSRIIDFRSEFTSTHTAGVAAAAEKLARLYGFSEPDCRVIHLAGLLHDLGKLAVPSEILNKAGRLNREEYDIIRRHSYYTYRILEPLKVLETVRDWGAFHHEKIDGGGYPFHLQEGELAMGARIVSVADVFTALAEDRPYRKGLKAEEALRVLEESALHNRLDREVVSLLKEHFAEMNDARSAAQASAREDYRLFMKTAAELTPPALV